MLIPEIFSLALCSIGFTNLHADGKFIRFSGAGNRTQILSREFSNTRDYGNTIDAVNSWNTTCDDGIAKAFFCVCVGLELDTYWCNNMWAAI